MRLFTPYRYVESIHDINFKELKDSGINCVLCDLDNTLVGHNIKIPSSEVIELIKEVNDYGLEFVIFSNNTENRVSHFCNDLGVKFYFSSRKPLRMTYKKILKETGVKADEMVTIGDQLLTDVLGSNKMGIKTILVDPVQKKDLIWTKINRFFENIVYRRLEKKKILKKGNYYNG